MKFQKYIVISHCSTPEYLTLLLFSELVLKQHISQFLFRVDNLKLPRPHKRLGLKKETEYIPYPCRAIHQFTKLTHDTTHEPRTDRKKPRSNQRLEPRVAETHRELHRAQAGASEHQ